MYRVIRIVHDTNLSIANAEETEICNSSTYKVSLDNFQSMEKYSKKEGSVISYYILKEDSKTILSSYNVAINNVVDYTWHPDSTI
jgi:hypothetical protein